MNRKSKITADETEAAHHEIVSSAHLVSPRSKELSEADQKRATSPMRTARAYPGMMLLFEWAVA